MGSAIGLRADYDGAGLRRLARVTRSANQGRRLLALAEIYDGGSRTAAARQCHGEARLRTGSTTAPLNVRRGQYMNNRIEQDHRRIKRRTRPMLGFKAAHSAAIILGGIELIHMIRKGQLIRTDTRNLPVARQFNSLAS